MRSAADAEDKSEKHIVMPGRILAADRAMVVVKGLLLAAALSILGVYASDYAWLEYRIGHDTAGQAFGSVTFYYATALKNGRTEIFYGQPQTEVCVQALFPHAGYRPCCYAARSQVRMVIKGGSGRQIGSIGMAIMLSTFPKWSDPHSGAAGSRWDSSSWPGSAWRCSSSPSRPSPRS